MRKLIISAAIAVGFAAPALADTLEAVTTKGVILSVQGMEIPINYAEDGTFSGNAMGQDFTGNWSIKDGELCTTSDFQPEETCQAYPADKGPGDEFTIEGAMGPVTIKINE